MQDHDGDISITDISQITRVRESDIIRVLQEHDMIKFSKGQHVLFADEERIETALKKAGGVGLPVDPKKIIWTPYNPDRDIAKT